MIERLIQGLNERSLYKLQRKDALTRQMQGLYSMLSTYWSYISRSAEIRSSIYAHFVP
jgi:hypothetical protein